MEGERTSFTPGSLAEYFFEVIKSKKKKYLLWYSLPQNLYYPCRLANWDSQRLKILPVFVNPLISSGQPWMLFNTWGKALLYTWLIVSTWKIPKNNKCYDLEWWFSKCYLQTSGLSILEFIRNSNIRLPTHKHNKSEILGWDPEMCIWRSPAGDSDTC